MIEESDDTVDSTLDIEVCNAVGVLDGTNGGVSGNLVGALDGVDDEVSGNVVGALEE